MTTPTFLNADQAAAVLGVSRRFIEDELRRKNLRGTKLPGKLGWRLTAADIERYADSRANVSKVRSR